MISKDVLRETSYEVQTRRAFMEANVPRLTPEQQQAFKAITGIMGSERGGIVFLMHQGDLSAGQFANKSLQIGDGKVPEDLSTGLMPCGQIVSSPDEFQSKVYPNIQKNLMDQDWISHRTILASRIHVVEKLNVTIQKQLPGQEYAYKIIDFTFNDEEAVQYPVEFLNSIQTLICKPTTWF
ncbi:ATP-dependent DNA helicase [Trichonephila clavipes]|nr:ATP-dependent DNA helicase [Trichonephila clavipes]